MLGWFVCQQQMADQVGTVRTALWSGAGQCLVQPQNEVVYVVRACEGGQT